MFVSSRRITNIISVDYCCFCNHPDFPFTHYPSLQYSQHTKQAVCCLLHNTTCSRPKGNNWASSLSPLSECWSFDCTWCDCTGVVASVLRIEEITVRHVTELADSLDVFCLQVLSSLTGCTFCFFVPYSSAFLTKSVLSQSWKTQ